MGDAHPQRIIKLKNIMITSTNTDLAIEKTLDFIIQMIENKSNIEITKIEILDIKNYLKWIANSKKVDILNQINNEK